MIAAFKQNVGNEASEPGYRILFESTTGAITYPVEGGRRSR